MVGADGRFAYASPSHGRELAREPDRLVGRRVTDFVHPDDRDRLEGALRGAASGDKVEYRLRTGSGRWTWVESALRPAPSRWHGGAHSQVIDGRKRLEDELRLRAPRPADRPGQPHAGGAAAHRGARRSRRGRPRGPAVLRPRSVPRRSTTGSATRPATTCSSRWPPSSATACAPVTCSAGSAATSSWWCSTGCATLPTWRSWAGGWPARWMTRSGCTTSRYASRRASAACSACGRTSTASAMLRDADAAMYAAKDRGLGLIEVFDDAASSRSLDRLGLRSDLLGALEGDQLCRALPAGLRPGQRAGGRVRGAAARWTHPQRGEVPPDVFIAPRRPVPSSPLDTGCLSSRAASWRDGAGRAAGGCGSTSTSRRYSSAAPGPRRAARHRATVRCGPRRRVPGGDRAQLPA